MKQHHERVVELEVLKLIESGGRYTDTVWVYPQRLRAYTHTTQVDGPLVEGLDVGSVVFSYSIFLTLYFCFRSFSPARSHLHLTFWLQSGEEGSYHTGSHYLIISLSRRGEEIAGGDFFSTRCVKTVLLCFSSYFFFLQLLHIFETCSAPGSTVKLLSSKHTFYSHTFRCGLPHWSAQYFQPQISLQSTTVPSRPGEQQSHCIISQTLVRDDTWATHRRPCSNRQSTTTQIQHGKSQHHTEALLAFPADVSCSLSLCVGLRDIEHLALIGCQLLSKSVWRLSP